MMDARTTAQLLSDLEILQTFPSTPETRLVGAMIADTVTDREGIDSALDDVFSNDDFAGTYLDAMRIALSSKGSG